MRVKPQFDVETEEGTHAMSAWFPAGWKEKAGELGAFVRVREIRSALDLVRLIFASVILRKSLPELALWARDRGIADLEFPSLWERFERAMPFLRWLLENLVRQAAPPPQGDWIFEPVDATTFSLPGSKKRDWLVHAAWGEGGFQYLKVTPGKGRGNGESTSHFNELPNRVVRLTDRAYGTPPQLTRLEREEKKFISRFTWNNLPLYEDRECRKAIDPRKWLSDLLPGGRRERPAWLRAKKEEPVQVRAVVLRKDPQAAERARRMARSLSERKGHTPRDLTLFLADFVTLATNLTESELSTPAVLDAYRWRWQIELAFKRFKSSTLIRRLANQKEAMVRLYLYAALCLWLLTERMARERVFFPWGYPLGPGSEGGAGRSGAADEICVGIDS